MITLETALAAARQVSATVTERAERQGYYTGARTDIINSHAELRAALDLLIKAAEHTGAPAGRHQHRPAASNDRQMPPAGASGSGMDGPKAGRGAGRRSRLGWKPGHPAAVIPGKPSRPGRAGQGRSDVGCSTLPGPARPATPAGGTTATG